VFLIVFEETRLEDDRTRLQLIAALLAQGEFHTAETELSTVTSPALRVEGWRLLSRTHASVENWSGARAAIEIALRGSPASRSLRLERAAIMDQEGFAYEALVELERLASEAEDSPQLLAHLARALQLAGRIAEAEAKLESGLRRWPTHVQLHTLLARLRWQRGCADRSTLWLEQAISQFPGELQLRLVAADLLRNIGSLEKALVLLQGGLRIAPESAGFLTSIGVVLDGLERPLDALPYLRRAAARAPSSVPVKRNLIPTLLRVAEPREALAICDDLLEQAPDDQQLIAYRATALRMLGDAQYAALHDYDRLVRVYRPAPPGRFSSIADFNRAFAREALRLHTADHRPLDQSLRGGTQTDRNLPRDNPVFASFFEMIDAPIGDYISHLSESSAHPTDRRKSDAYRIAGSWSVRLEPGGFHLNHVHPKGWLSSAYYIEIPDTIGTREGDRSGWLKFGEPGATTPGCGANHFVRPEPGMLVLFPSYIWHGTVPFHDGGRRLTAAFDVVPTAASEYSGSAGHAVR
jgi:tetratricopeptide (TPR) repeat protein